MTEPEHGRERRRRRAAAPRPTADTARYRHLENPFPPLELLSADHVGHIHRAALEILERDGIRVLHPEAREHYASAGAAVDIETNLVRFAAGLVEQTLATAPSSFELVARNP